MQPRGTTAAAAACTSEARCRCRRYGEALRLPRTCAHNGPHAAAAAVQLSRPVVFLARLCVIGRDSIIHRRRGQGIGRLDGGERVDDEVFGRDGG